MHVKMILVKTSEAHVYLITVVIVRQGPSQGVINVERVGAAAAGTVVSLVFQQAIIVLITG